VEVEAGVDGYFLAYLWEETGGVTRERAVVAVLIVVTSFLFLILVTTPPRPRPPTM
jgi:hypothetical protein